MNSPFSDRRMITDADRFFGRKAETHKVFNALAANSPQCVSIIGERRIGRSSLLQHLLRNYHQHLPQPDRYRFAYLDLSRDTIRRPRQFYAEAAQAFGADNGNSMSPQQFDEWLSGQNPQRDWHYVILLDEFNALQRRRERFDDDFYDGLRSRANAGEITFVVASHVPLHEIAIANDFTSSFFGIFTPVDLKGFGYDEAKASMLRPDTRPLRLVDFDNTSDWAKDDDTNRYHPLKLNMAADLIWQEPNATYEQIKIKYDSDVAYVFGEVVHKAKRRKRALVKANGFWRWLRDRVNGLTGEKPYLLFGLLFVLVLLAIGIINMDQFWGFVRETVGVPTVTPVPTLAP